MKKSTILILDLFSWSGSTSSFYTAWSQAPSSSGPYLGISRPSLYRTWSADPWGSVAFSRPPCGRFQMGEGVVIFAFWRQQIKSRWKSRCPILNQTFLPDATVPSTLGAARGIPGAAGKPWHTKIFCLWGWIPVLGIALMTATFGSMTGCHRTSRPATELGMHALSHPDCIPDNFEAVGLRQPILVVFASVKKWMIK